MTTGGRARAAEYFVSPMGSDSNPGSLTQPFATLQKGNDAAVAGDTVWLRGGTYPLTRQVRLSKSGRSDTQRINFWAYEKEVPLFDCSRYVSTNRGSDVPVIEVTGNWLHLKGWEIANVAVGTSGAHSISALRSEGASYNIFERLNIHHSFGPGLFISAGMGGNLILNCDSHDNYDKNGSQGDGQNGDGFGVHYQLTGSTTIIRGCRAWLNSDDGYDLISQEMPVRSENSWAVMNGYANGGTVSPSSGNGNGFKAGSSERGVRHILQNNLAWKNKTAGFYANHSTGGNTWLNNTAYMNAVQYDMLASPAGTPSVAIILSGALAHKMRNNVGFPNRNKAMSGVDSMFNTWDLNMSEVNNDFVDTMDTGYAGPRQDDGSVPDLPFLKPCGGSPLIDKGTNVALPYVGAAPDLGALEFGAVTPIGGGTGGATGGGTGGRGSGGNAVDAGTGSDGTSETGGSGPGSGGARGGSGGSGGGKSNPGTGGGMILATGGSNVAGAGGFLASSGGATAAVDGGPSRTGGTVGMQLPGIIEGGCACALPSMGEGSEGAGIPALGALALALAVCGRRRRRGCGASHADAFVPRAFASRD